MRPPLQVCYDAFLRKADSPSSNWLRSVWRQTKVDFTHTRIYAAGLYLVGLASGCPFRLSLDAAKQSQDLEEAEASVGRECAKVEEDATAERWRTPHGYYWIPKRPVSAESLFNMLGERQTGVYGGTRHGVRKDDVVLDCGSNIGTFVAEALDAGASLVVACEPSPSNLECLRRNFAQQVGSGRVIICPKGLWHETTTLTLTFGISPGGDSFLGNKAGGIELPVTTIDELVNELRLDRVDFIKMDIEGAERNALRGGHDTIRRLRPRLAISSYHLPDDAAVLRAESLKAYDGYKLSCTHARLLSSGVLHSRIAPVIYFFAAS